MRREVFNDAGERNLVFVLGWGNRIDHENVQWVVDRLVDADYRVTVFQIPTVITDFDAEWVAPVAEYVDDLEGYRLLTHSTGGLIAEFLEGAETRVYLSPWWGFHDDLRTPVVSLLLKLPVSRSILPTGGTDREMLGELATDRQLADTPGRVAPTFLREAKRAQRRLPPFQFPESGVVFYTPDDAVVGVDAILERAPESNRVAYEGGHQLFDSPSRETHVGTILDALEAGRAALE
ncbi:alpha/beta hydrolase [Haloterrigena alkaliphila]|uniref:Alpha/beta hydrolase n=1 Tax=Haloterrigena alkaliphila TaxID=2816475 RepID=A0A8A2VF01_9EURY|nr:alpha/beta hydrolase [Haloterrigena alkaliphila]QSX00092.1 alpha/beta hydrolase [Haloterrigena alkaliphila]